MKLSGLLLLSAALVLAADKNPAAEKEVLAAAKELARAQMAKDRAALEKLLGEEIVYSHSTGMRETKAEHIAATMRPTSKYESIDLTEPKAMIFGTTAVLIVKARFVSVNDGKKQETPLSMMQTWVKRGGGWQLVARWTTRLAQ